MDVWDVGPNTPTSDEDEDGMIKPKRGHGRVGQGSPMLVFHGGSYRPFIDGSGLCSPGRWHPGDRAVDIIAQRIRDALLGVLRRSFPDTIKLLLEIAVGRFDVSPFSDQMLQEGRRLVMAAVGMEREAAERDPVPNQPFYLHLLSEVARVLGDPDWRVLVTSKESFATGVRVGFKSRLPRTPAVYDRKVRWRRYDAADFALELKANYNSTAGVEEDLKKQFEEEIALGMMEKRKLTEARKEYGDRLRVAPLGALKKLDLSVRPLHDGTHGSGVNPNLRVRDQPQCPTNSDLRHALSLLHAMPGRTFGMKADVSKAHRRYLHRKADWGLMACLLLDPDECYLNRVGKIGRASCRERV